MTATLPKVFITGIDGFAGTNIVPMLQQKGWSCSGTVFSAEDQKKVPTLSTVVTGPLEEFDRWSFSK